MAAHKYTARHLREAAGISGVTYDQWRARGYIRSEKQIEGSGNRQLYSFDEVFRAAVLARLVALGLSVGNAAKIVNPDDFTIGGVKPATLYGFRDARAYLVVRVFPHPDVDGASTTTEYTTTVGEIVRENDVIDKLDRCDGAVILSLDKIEARVQKALESEV